MDFSKKTKTLNLRQETHIPKKQVYDTQKRFV